MLSQKFLTLVNDYDLNVFKDAKTWDKTRNGQFTLYQLGTYIKNIEFLLKHTPLCLEISIAQADVKKYPPIILNYLKQKLVEETGHEQWAKDDLKMISLTQFEKNSLTILNPMKDLCSYLLYLAKDPYAYLGYIFFAEYFTVTRAPQWIKELEAHCGLSPKNLTAITKHVELDKEHVREEVNFLDNCPEINMHWSRIKSEFQVYSTYFFNFFEKLSEVSPKRDVHANA